MTDTPTLRIAHLYPDHMNLYGDRGNVLCLVQRCLWRGWQAEVIGVGLGEAINPDYYDLYFMGGGQDTQQIKIVDDLHATKADSLRQAAANQAVFLTICGGYQLLGHYYKPHQGPELKGLSLMDVTTVAGHTRFIGNVSIRRPDGTTLVGFENHSGLTTLGKDVQPLGKVIRGRGNNGQDGTEGAVFGHLYGTYLHGSLLPKNPALADELITKALARRYGQVTLPTLANDQLEAQAHQRALVLKS
jgi:CobQ-like glutamine amidotransferase family enzyme